MTIYGDARGKVINVNGNPFARLIGLGIAGFLFVILLFASVARVESGNVGVLTLFGRVTGEVLPEGIHLVNPFKVNHELTIRTQEIRNLPAYPRPKVWS